MKHTKKVFIFDDNREIIELCLLLLEEFNCEVKTSPTTNDAVAQIKAFQPDLIFMDNWLPDVSGVQATQAIKEDPELTHIPVVYFTANYNIKELAEEAGADDYLSKPFDIAGFEKIVNKYIG